jgi:hypothetical protein
MSSVDRDGFNGCQLPTPKETIVTPNMIQAVARSRIDDLVWAADRHRLAAAAVAARHAPAAALKSIAHRRRLRVGIA